MASIAVYFKQLKGRDKGNVYVLYTKDSRSRLFSTGVSCPPEYFDKSKAPNYISRHLSGFQQMNRLIKSKLNEIDAAVSNMGGEPEPEYLKIEVENNKDKRPKQSPGKIYENLKSRFIKVKKGEGVHKYTIYQYNQLFKRLDEFKPSIDLSVFNDDFGESFTIWLQTIAKDGEPYAPNTVGRYIKSLKTFLAYASKKHNLSDAFKGYEKPEEIKDIISLSKSEVKKLREATLFKESHQKKRDLFLFMVYSGVRVSDLYQVVPNIEEGNMSIFRPFKTKKKKRIPVRIPITKEMKEIIVRYGGDLPKYSPQKINEDLPSICRQAGIKEVTNHTARKTFISLALNNGVSLKAVQEQTGITTDVLLKHYHSISASEQSEMIQKFWDNVKV